MRDGHGHLVHARLDEPGMLVARLAQRAASDIAHIDPRRVLRDAFAQGDAWFITGDFMKVDAVGDYWFVDRKSHMIRTRMGLVASTRIEDAIYAYSGVALCIAVGKRDGDRAKFRYAAIQLHHTLDIGALTATRCSRCPSTRAAASAMRIVERLPMTDGFRPLKHGLGDLDEAGGPDVLAWDPLAQRRRDHGHQARGLRRVAAARRRGRCGRSARSI